MNVAINSDKENPIYHLNKAIIFDVLYDTNIDDHIAAKNYQLAIDKNIKAKKISTSDIAAIKQRINALKSQ